MKNMDRLPAIPLIANDPYFSVWLPGDTLNSAGTVHWSGAPKTLYGTLRVDGKEYCFLGKSSLPGMETRSLRVTPTRTASVLSAGGVDLSVGFWSPALPEDPDVLSIPVTFADFALSAADGGEHAVSLSLTASGDFCYDGAVPPPLRGDLLKYGPLNMAMLGQVRQRVLGHSGDHITMDWGYLYMASEGDVRCREERELAFTWDGNAGKETVRTGLMLGYDDVASVNYFGEYCRAWGLRGGKTMPQAMTELYGRKEELRAACEKLDETVLSRAEEIGGEDYRLIAAASWRHTFAAHKLIAAPSGEMAFLSKENDSNGCIGTVDVSYPSVPLFLRFCPELVNALCRPVLAFASMPVWTEDFAPHDVGRYPWATGQVYAAKKPLRNGETPPPYYLYPAGTDVYDPRYQMPVEECGNMLIMLEAALHFGADDSLVRRYAALLDQWVGYLDAFGEDPGEQLCTDDFAGHLARNVNLSAKAFTGIACYARILRRTGRGREAGKWEKRAREMAGSWLERASAGGYTALTFDGTGWSMKYNLIWDRVLKLNLLPEEFYETEVRSYLDRLNRFGLPLDSRADYTKSDWEIWSACLTRDTEVFRRLAAPLARCLRESETRVPFSDWYDTKTGRYVAFIGRSVQGGVYMPFLAY